jgi:hypothetical protein
LTEPEEQGRTNRERELAHRSGVSAYPFISVSAQEAGGAFTAPSGKDLCSPGLLTWVSDKESHNLNKERPSPDIKIEMNQTLEKSNKDFKAAVLKQCPRINL